MENMMKIDAVAKAFANNKALVVGNASTDGSVYKLFGNTIAYRVGGSVIIDWCGYYTMSTARHLNNIAKATGANVRFSFAQARDKAETCLTLT
jgi:hypothetical protein